MNTQHQSNPHTVRNLTIFTILVIVLPWFGRWLDTAMKNPPEQQIGMTIWIVTPLVVSLLLRGFAGDGWKDLGIKPHFKGNLLWYLISLLVYPVCVILILVIGRAFGIISFPDFSPDTVELIIQGIVTILITQIIKNIFEEFAFRGYLAPKMYTLKLNAFVAHGVVGLIWGVWHLPYLRQITTYTTESLVTLIPRFLVGAIAASIVYGEIRKQTNSVWPAWLMHTVGATFVGALMLHSGITISSGMEFLFNPVFEGGLTIIFFLVLGIGLYLLRRR
jgi:membrane protease YdiL (CAAX protease family)